MPTGQTIVTNALTVLGINGQGETPSASDSNDALAELNAMWAAWGIDEGLIFAVATAQYALIQNTGTYLMGPGGSSPYNVAVPARIYQAYFATSTSRAPLRMVEESVYFAHGDLSAAARQSDELYVDWGVDPASGDIVLRLWPVPSVAGANLELETAAAFSIWSLGGAYNLPEGFQDAIQYALAWRLIPRYGAAVAQQIVEIVEPLASKAEARIREMNAKNRQIPAEAAGLAPPQAAKGS